MTGPPRHLLLAFDTSTRWTTVAVGDGRALGAHRRADREAEPLLEHVDEALDAAGAAMEDLRGIVVGTGPGSFTGLRVALATAKTLAYACSLPLVGVSSAAALARAAATAGEGAGPAGYAVIMAAGARDHYLAIVDVPADADRPVSQQPRVLPPGTDLAAEVVDALPVPVGLAPDTLGPRAQRRGEAALQGLGAALLAIGRTRLDEGDQDDVATLVPEYVALPRGVSDAGREMAWSPDLP